jgi:hypothetical protein
MGLHQGKKLLHSNGNSPVKRRPAEWENILPKYVSEKG